MLFLSWQATIEWQNSHRNTTCNGVIPLIIQWNWTGSTLFLPGMKYFLWYLLSSGPFLPQNKHLIQWESRALFSYVVWLNTRATGVFFGVVNFANFLSPFGQIFYCYCCTLQQHSVSLNPRSFSSLAVLPCYDQKATKFIKLRRYFILLLCIDNSPHGKVDSRMAPSNGGRHSAANPIAQIISPSRRWNYLRYRICVYACTCVWNYAPYYIQVEAHHAILQSRSKAVILTTHSTAILWVLWCHTLGLYCNECKHIFMWFHGSCVLT